MRMILTLLVLLLPAAGLAQVTWEPYVERIGPAQVVDGDRIAVAGVEVRLYGIDAPELEQACQTRTGRQYACGQQARAMLTRLVDTVDITCYTYAPLQDGSVTGRCFRGNRDIGGLMVELGWAFAMPGLTTRYAGLEARAQARRSGFWAGYVQRPWLWRSDRRLEATQ